MSQTETPTEELKRCSEVIPVQSEQTLCVTSLRSSWKSLFRTVSMRVQEDILCPSGRGGNATF